MMKDHVDWAKEAWAMAMEVGTPNAGHLIPFFKDAMEQARADAELKLALEESSHTQTIAKDNARIAVLEGALRALTAKEPRDSRTANTLGACAYCGKQEDKAAWEAWHDKHGWGWQERDAEHRECPDMPIAHKPDCAYALACKLEVMPRGPQPKPDPMCSTCSGSGLVTEDDADGTRHSDIPCPDCGR